MAEDVSAVPADDAPLVERPARRERARRSAYRFRFGLVYVVLAAIVGAGVGTFVVLASRPGPPEAAEWSAWKPEGSGEAMAKQIADHVSTRYRLPSGNQLAVALVGPPQVQDVAVRAIAVRPDTSRGLAEEDDIEVVETANTAMYILCGLGQQCAIAEGEASPDRHQLLRREALELSLYTLKYVEGVDSVLTFLPPPPGAEEAGTGSTVFLRRADLRDELRRPLNQTLLRTKPPELGQIDTIERATIDRLTRPRVYGYEFQQTQDGNAILVLTPVPLAS